MAAVSPLVLIQGLGLAAWAWGELPALLGGARRVVVFDNPGTGSEPGPPPETIEEAADFAASRFEGPADVLGFSMGGYIAQTLAVRRPELVRSLVLVATSAGGPDRTPRPPETVAIHERALTLPAAEAGRYALPVSFAPGWCEAHAEEFERILALRLEQPTPLEVFATQRAACDAWLARGGYAERIRAPALVVHGDADRIVPWENAPVLAAKIPGARLVRIAGGGHLLPLERPRELAAAVMAFLG